jgi:hypothetical protein
MSIQDKVTIGVKAGSAQEMLFRGILSTGGTWQVTVNADSLAASSVYGVVFIEYLVQFRNRA